MTRKERDEAIQILQDYEGQLRYDLNASVLSLSYTDQIVAAYRLAITALKQVELSDASQFPTQGEAHA